MPLHLPHTRWRVPEQFDGNFRPAVQAFLQQTGLYCLAHPDQFPYDRSKIIFMLTKPSGNTAKWAQPLNQRAKFITSFNSYFLDPERKGKAQQALHNFKQSGNRQYPGELYRGGLKENI
ncbi:uncharacterized protein VP01_3064g2 [Puccinia sorghi]|uniref:DUF4939 domain-containing protein n=1 Tax=Puccinia sorghi TaxID=27349 RepID=A0A0L6UZT1_9BASI|nr:uncharacterized protein VP01_3064g2 [Puccinia sorghi]